MIMGASGSVEWFYPIIPVYSNAYKLIIFDNRDAGQTESPDIPYTTETLADDLAGLLNAVGINSANIYGSSMGGMIAQQFAIRYPKKLRSLILGCTYCGGPGSSIMPDPKVMEASQRMVNLSGRELMMEMLRLCVSQKFMDNNPKQIQQMVELMIKHPMSSEGQKRQTQAVMSHNTYEQLPEIKTPTLVITGDADKLVPMENSKIIASRIPGAELVILKGMGHIFGMEAAGEDARIILDFLKRHRLKESSTR